MVGENFQIYGVHDTAKSISKIKTESRHFYPCPPDKTLPQVFIITPEAEGNNSPPK